MDAVVVCSLLLDAGVAHSPRIPPDRTVFPLLLKIADHALKGGPRGGVLGARPPSCIDIEPFPSRHHDVGPGLDYPGAGPHG